MDHINNIVEVCAHNVHLVDVDHTGDLIVVRLTPYGLGLGLDSALCAHNGHRSVEHAERTLDLNGEVHVARGINDVYTVSLPETGGGGGGDRYSPLLLLLHPVHSGVALVGLAELMVYTGIKKDTLGSRGLSGINVRHDADISRVFK